MGDKLVIRTAQPVGDAGIRLLNRDFRGIPRRGQFQRAETPLPEEGNEPETFSLARLVFDFNRRDFSRLHQLIEVINRA